MSQQTTNQLDEQIADAIRLVRSGASAKKTDPLVTAPVSEPDGAESLSPPLPEEGSIRLSPPTVPSAQHTTEAGPKTQQRTEAVTSVPHTPGEGEIENPPSVAAPSEKSWSTLSASSRPLEVTCPLGELVTGLQAVSSTASRSEERAVFLSAERGHLFVFSFWEGASLAYRIPAGGGVKGMVKLPLWVVSRILEQLAYQKKSATKKGGRTPETFDALPAEILTKKGAGKGTRGHTTLTLTVPETAWSFQTKSAEAGTPAAYEHLLQLSAYGWGEGSSLGESTRIVLDAAGLRTCYAPVVAASQRLQAHTGHPQRNSPYYGILLRFDDGSGSEGQRVTCVASDGTRTAARRTTVAPPIALQDGASSLIETVLPSWSVDDVLPILPTTGRVALDVYGATAALSTHRWLLRTDVVSGPGDIPAFGSTAPTTRATVDRAQFQQVLKSLARAMREVGVPSDGRIVTLTTDPEGRVLRIGIPPFTPSASRFAEATIPLWEVVGPVSSITVPIGALDEGLVPVERSAELTWCEPPAPYPFLIRPRVPNGYVYALQPTHHPLRPIAQEATEEEMRVFTGRLRLGEQSVYGIEERATTERPTTIHTVLARNGRSHACSCGQTAPALCDHMRTVNDFLREQRVGNDR